MLQRIVTTKRHGEKINRKEKAKEKQRFPLVEDDNDANSMSWVVDDTKGEGVSNIESNNVDEEF